MSIYIINNVRARVCRLVRLRCHRVAALTPVAVLALTACQSDWRDGIAQAEQEEMVAFGATVVSSRVATRADASLVNLNEYHLPATASSGHSVGIFGAYTGQYTWSTLQTIAAKKEADRTDDEKNIWKAGGDNYKANFFFNQQAAVTTLANGHNALSYAPLRFWPNAIVSGTQREYCSFWAYYPWNETGDPGDNGIAVVPTGGDYNMATGLGKLKFTMNPDVAKHVDFLLSDFMADCSRTSYPLVTVSDGTDVETQPTRVPLTFHHALAQVRIYAFIRCTDKLVYAKNGDAELRVKTGGITSSSVTLTDGTSDFVVSVETANQKYTDAWGKAQTVAEGDRIPDDTQWLTVDLKTKNTERWKRTTSLDDGDLGDGNGTKYFADKTMSVAFNNLYSSAIFTPTTGKSAFTAVRQGTPTGSATVSDYQFRNDWFLYKDGTDQRIMLNTDHMYGTDGSDVSYFDPGNIMLVVPQTLTDDDVPSIVVTVNGKDAADDSKALSARVTVNMLNLGISWESGYIYSYAIIEELQPGDDKVKGPENIIVVFDPDQNTDQW